MHDSKIIEINGIFLGAAVALNDHAGWQVVAADARALRADGQIGKTYRDAQALARHAFWSFVPARSLNDIIAVPGARPYE